MLKTNPFQLRNSHDVAVEDEAHVHVIGPGIVCDTESRGHATPGNRSPLELLVDATEGFIPLWAKGSTLRWRFHEGSMGSFEDPVTAKAGIKELLGEALLAWGEAAPVKFTQRDDAWDFQIVMRVADQCTVNGCVLASAFFPDPGRHRLTLYPKLFEQSRKEQVDTFIHEIGHIFGLRHFFALVGEAAWPAEVFGTHQPFTIMNYGDNSELTNTDKDDLKELYSTTWSGELTEINGTPIRLVKPFTSTGVPVVPVGSIAASQKSNGLY